MKTVITAVLTSLCLATTAAFAGVEQTVTDLIPRLAAEKVEDRYAAQMELQALAANASRPGAETERRALAIVLTAKAGDAAVPQPARVWCVRQLELIGGNESVTILSPMLKNADAELRECARRALERNASPAASGALRAALEQCSQSAQVIGLISSLGERADSAAVGLIVPYLKQKETVAAATSALGKIASDQAVEILWRYHERVPGTAEALVTAGNRVLLGGKSAKAAALFNRLYLAGQPQSSATSRVMNDAAAPVEVRCAALVGLAEASPKSARSLIEPALRQGEAKLGAAAVTAARMVYGKGRNAELARLLPGLPVTAKPIVLRELDGSVEKEIIRAAADPEEMVRAAALERLGEVGSAASVPVLIRYAAESPSGSQKAAATLALARIHGPGAESAVRKAAAQGEPASRAAAIKSLADRNDRAAVPALLKYAAEVDPGDKENSLRVSSAACLALGKLGTDSEIEALARLTLAGRAPEAEAALEAVSGRARDKAAAAATVLAAISAATPEQRSHFLGTLALLGSDKSLAEVSELALGASGETKDAAVRALANWSEFAAIKPLLIIASDPNSSRTHNVLAVQGVARLVKSSEKEASPARLEAAQAAMKAAARDEERKLALSAFAAVPSALAAEALKPFLSQPPLQAEAGQAALTLAKTLRSSQESVAKDLALAVIRANISEELTRKAEAILNK